jgi:hypothetical protein
MASPVTKYRCQFHSWAVTLCNCGWCCLFQSTCCIHPHGRSVEVVELLCIRIYRVSQEECARLREGVPYVKIYRYNPKHLCPKVDEVWMTEVFVLMYRILEYCVVCYTNATAWSAAVCCRTQPSLHWTHSSLCCPTQSSLHFEYSSHSSVRYEPVWVQLHS